MIDHDEPDVERISDESDRASKIEMDGTQECLRRTLAKVEKAPDYFDGTHCIECGEPIPEARLKIGGFRDIFCQQQHELRSKNHRSYFE